MAQVEHTPLMKQYHEIKEQYPNTLLMFQVGDFYELFFDDAKNAAAALGIALTARGKSKGEPIPLCGVPLHAKDHYVPKLVRAGFNVAICEQLEPPQPGAVVKRGVTQVLTPGTLTDESLLDEKSASYLFSFVPLKDAWGLLFGELLTAQLFATVIPATSEKTLEAELIRFFPDEVIVPSESGAKKFQSFFKQRGYVATPIDPQLATAAADEVSSWLQKQFNDKTRALIERHDALRQSINLFYAYLNKNQRAALAQFHGLNFYQADDFLILDAATQRHLELVKNSNDGGRRNTLFALVDRAATSMGSRMIKKWLLRPLVKQEQLVQRQEAVALFVQDQTFAQRVEHFLRSVGDIERIIGRIALNRAPVHDYLALSRALAVVAPLKAYLQVKQPVPLLKVIEQAIGDFSPLAMLLAAAFYAENDRSWIIKPGFDARLDQLRDLVDSAQQKIVALEKREQERTGINSLKVRYNQAHGYYIELTKTHSKSVPDDYQRKQTLVGKERFITPELRELQHDIFTARTEIDQVEQAVFEKVKYEIAQYVAGLRKLAHALSNLDALQSFGAVSYSQGYARPSFTTDRQFCIIDGRHPVVEQVGNHSFIPNDTQLSLNESTWIITGPNMGGKSTYLRQVALIAIMAQCGLFVPARQAKLSLLDRIFTRIGAGDNVSEGKSTFLVEMEETAQICTQATKKSLVILDEVGRGTSTFDGLAIAQAVVEYLHQEVKPYCLFATHYHELSQLQDRLPGVVSYYASSRKTQQGILFLYKMIRGVADGSFGVEVAKLAALPAQVILRAEEILQVLAHQENDHAAALHRAVADASSITGAYQVPTQVEERYQRLQQEYEALQAKLAQAQGRLARLDSLDYNELSPKKAFDLLWALKERD